MVRISPRAEIENLSTIQWMVVAVVLLFALMPRPAWSATAYATVTARVVASVSVDLSGSVGMGMETEQMTFAATDSVRPAAASVDSRAPAIAPRPAADSLLLGTAVSPDGASFVIKNRGRFAYSLTSSVDRSALRRSMAGGAEEEVASVTANFE